MRTAAHGHPQFSLKSWLPNRLTFLTGDFSKLKRGHVKRHAVALSVQGSCGHDFGRGVAFFDLALLRKVSTERCVSASTEVFS